MYTRCELLGYWNLCLRRFIFTSESSMLYTSWGSTGCHYWIQLVYWHLFHVYKNLQFRHSWDVFKYRKYLVFVVYASAYLIFGLVETSSLRVIGWECFALSWFTSGQYLACCNLSVVTFNTTVFLLAFCLRIQDVLRSSCI